MNSVRTLSGILGFGCFVLGSLMTYNHDSEVGRALLIAGAILIAGLTIASSIAHTRR